MGNVTPRYKAVIGCVGIRKDLWSGTFRARKKIRKKIYEESFKTLREARKWRNEFHPSVPQSNLRLPIILELNGKDLGFTLGDIWEKYKKIHLHDGRPKNTIRVTLERGERFYRELLDTRMVELNAECIVSWASTTHK